MNVATFIFAVTILSIQMFGKPTGGFAVHGPRIVKVLLEDNESLSKEDHGSLHEGKNSITMVSPHSYENEAETDNIDNMNKGPLKKDLPLSFTVKALKKNDNVITQVNDNGRDGFQFHDMPVVNDDEDYGKRTTNRISELFNTDHPLYFTIEAPKENAKMNAQANGHGREGFPPHDMPIDNDNEDFGKNTSDSNEELLHTDPPEVFNMKEFKENDKIADEANGRKRQGYGKIRSHAMPTINGFKVQDQRTKEIIDKMLNEDHPLYFTIEAPKENAKMNAQANGHGREGFQPHDMPIDNDNEDFGKNISDSNEELLHTDPPEYFNSKEFKENDKIADHANGRRRQGYGKIRSHAMPTINGFKVQDPRANEIIVKMLNTDPPLYFTLGALKDYVNHNAQANGDGKEEIQSHDMPIDNDNEDYGKRTSDSNEELFHTMFGKPTGGFAVRGSRIVKNVLKDYGSINKENHACLKEEKNEETSKIEVKLRDPANEERMAHGNESMKSLAMISAEKENETDSIEKMNQDHLKNHPPGVFLFDFHNERYNIGDQADRWRDIGYGEMQSTVMATVDGFKDQGETTLDGIVEMFKMFGLWIIIFIFVYGLIKFLQWWLE